MGHFRRARFRVVEVVVGAKAVNGCGGPAPQDKKDKKSKKDKNGIQETPRAAGGYR